MQKMSADPDSVRQTGELMCKARRLLAYGGFDGVVTRPLYYSDQGVFPQFAARAEGYELFDTTGQAFVDWVNGWGPVMLGYRHPDVEAAIKAQIPEGPIFSLMHPIEVEVASLLNAMIPCAEMVAFGKNGSDVLTAAVRVARTVTNRNIIVQYGMHGFHDWYTCIFPEARGVPGELRPLIQSFPYNDLKALKKLFKKFKGRVACVVMEPVREILPEKGYLEAVRKLATDQGALLIFDEVVTAFRLANGGAQEFYGVIPDLACIGKSMANGMPLSAIVGKREYMQFLPSVAFGMTFRGETLSLAAARAVLKTLKKKPVAEHLAMIGNQVREAFLRACAQTGVRCDLTGPPARMTFLFQDQGGLTSESIRLLFLQECLKNGVFTNGNLLPSFAHDEEAIERSVQGFSKALKVVAEAVGAGEITDQCEVGGALFGPRAMISNGFIDQIVEQEEGLAVSGWILLNEGAPNAVEFLSAHGVSVPAKTINRPDIAKAFPTRKNAKKAGYSAILPTHLFRKEGDFDFTLCAMQKNRIAFRCRVFRHQRASVKNTPDGPFSTSDGVLYI